VGVPGAVDDAGRINGCNRGKKGNLALLKWGGGYNCPAGSKRGGNGNKFCTAAVPGGLNIERRLLNSSALAILLDPKAGGRGWPTECKVGDSFKEVISSSLFPPKTLEMSVCGEHNLIPCWDWMCWIRFQAVNMSFLQ
jgi:hypothetical protein